MAKNKMKYLFYSLVVLALVVGFLAVKPYVGGTPLSVAEGGTPIETTQVTASGSDAGCNSIPTVTYATRDAYGTTAVSGVTTYYKSGSSPATTTALTNPQAGSSVSYWVDNTTWFTAPFTKTVACSANDPFIAKAYQNSSSISLSVYDSLNKVLATESTTLATSNSTALNVSIGASSIMNLEVSWTGVKNRASMPYGGCLLVEIPTNISSVTIGGEGITSGCPYQVTHNTLSVNNNYKEFTIPSGWDADGSAATKTFNVQILASANNPQGYGRMVFIPASYYVTNSGDFALDIEESLNDVNTRTFGTVRDFIFTIN